MTNNNAYEMPAPWGSITLIEDAGELAGIRPSLKKVNTPSAAPEAIAEVMQLLEDTLSVPQRTSEEVLEALSRTRTYRNLPDFTRRVLEVASAIAPGDWMTYSEVAGAVGSPGAARAVGQALALNPFPVLIACHRVCGSFERTTFDILKPETFRPQAYMGESSLAPVAQWLRLLDFSL